MLRAGVLAMTLAALSPLAATSVEARAGGGFSFGSRGSRSFSAPPTTMTAPRPAFPLGQAEAARPGLQSFRYGQPRRFGFGSGLAAGLLGAGVLGMLTGHGFFGGLGGVMSLFGMLFQFALLAGLAWLVIGFFRNRNPATAAAGANGPLFRRGFGSGSGRMGGGGAAPSGPLNVVQPDFAAFERTLSDVQYAFSRGDLNELGRLATPDVVRRFADQLSENRRRGVRNEVTETRLVQGDLAEAWNEGAADFATVAMRFAARDVMLDLTSGRVVGGDPDRLVEATELWTFTRGPGMPWRVSAIQQTS